MVWRRVRQTQKPARLLELASERGQVPVESDEVEQVAVLAGGSIAPFACSFAMESNIEALTRCVGDVADAPIPPGAATIGQILATDCLGMLGKVLCQASRLRPDRGVVHRAAHELGDHAARRCAEDPWKESR